MVCSKFAELCVWCDVIRDAERQGVLWYEGRGGTDAKVLETAEIAERETKDAQNSCRVSQNRNKTLKYIKWQHHQEGGDSQA